MASQISRMMWARIRRRVDALVYLGLTPIEVLELLDKIIKIETERKEAGKGCPLKLQIPS